MDGDVEQVSVSDMEALIRRLPTVLRCAVSVNDWGAVEEIHVLSTLDRAPKQVVRDVESALMAQWGLRVDHKRISVAQIVEEGPVRAAPRLVVVEFKMELDAIKGWASAYVELQPADDHTVSYRGEWSGRYVPSQYYQIMALAAVEAVNNVPFVGEPLVLTELQTLSLGGRQVVVLALSFLNPRRREEMLIGAAPDRGDGQGASVRATLDAVNRKLGAMRRQGRRAAPTASDDPG